MVRTSTEEGATWLTGKGKSLPRMGFSYFSVVPTRFYKSKWLGKQYFKTSALITRKDAKGCQKARLLLGNKMGMAAACRLHNINQGLCEGGA